MTKASLNKKSEIFFQYPILQTRILEYNISRKAKPFPSLFQIQTINSCNASCEMCPISKMSKIKPEILPNELFEKIIKEISHEHLKYTQIYPYLQNEPLMDSDIFNKLKKIKEISNNEISTGLVTNGALFNDYKIKELENSKLDLLIISLDAFKEETYKKIRKGLNFKKVQENIDKIKDSKFNNGLAVKFVLQKENFSELKDFKKYWKKKGVSVHLDFLTNRSGDLNDFNNLSLSKQDIPSNMRLKSYFDRMLTRGCHYPLLTFNILSNGDVILCCNNYSKKTIIGNVKKSSIKEIWNNNKYKKIREWIIKKEYSKIPACVNCSYAKK